MAIFDSTKEYIETIIKDNDNGDITADLLRSVLLNIVETTETSINNINTRLDKIDAALRDIIVNYDNE
jgi:hypothetical protein